MSDIGTITIKNGPLNLKVPRSELLEVSPTHDGMSFTFKGGLQLYYTNTYMDNNVKSVMAVTPESYPGKNIVYDFKNPKRPVYIDAT
jgi:hypothetical protein